MPSGRGQPQPPLRFPPHMATANSPSEAAQNRRIPSSKARSTVLGIRGYGNAAPRFRLGAPFAMVVDLAVEGDDGVAVVATMG